MKALILAVVALSSVSAYAFPSADQSWAEILKYKGFHAMHPFAGVGGIFNLCATDTEFRTIQAVDACLEWKQIVPPNPDQDAYWICAATELRQKSISRTHDIYVCLKEAPMGNPETYTGPICLEYEKRTVIYPTTFTLEVRYSYPNHDDFQFWKDYTIPACQ